MPGDLVSRACRRGFLPGVVWALLSVGCADPGRAALDRLVRGAEALIVLAQRHASGELDERALNAALASWDKTERAEIETLSSEASRALGSALRAALAERWRDASERLYKRLSTISADIEPPR